MKKVKVTCRLDIIFNTAGSYKKGITRALNEGFQRKYIINRISEREGISQEKSLEIFETCSTHLHIAPPSSLVEFINLEEINTEDTIKIATNNGFTATQIIKAIMEYNSLLKYNQVAKWLRLVEIRIQKDNRSFKLSI